MKKEITKYEKLQIIGIIALGQQAAKKMKECDDALNEILEAKDSFDTGCLNDLYFEDSYNITSCLKKMEIKVNK